MEIHKKTPQNQDVSVNVALVDYRAATTQEFADYTEHAWLPAGRESDVTTVRQHATE